MTEQFSYKFEKPVILEVTGRDSERYLQARLTNNIKTLNDQQGLIAACLTPQGKTKALFRVYRKEINHYLLFSLAGDSLEIKKNLGCFIVADRVEITDRSLEFSLFAIKGLADNLATTAQIVFYDNYLSLNLVIFNSNVSDISLNYPVITKEEFTCYRIKNGLPEFPEEIREDSLFPEARLTQAISNSKGCYAGQEVVERVIALGKLPAKLLAFKAKSDLEQGSFDNAKVVNEQGVSAGQILNQVFDSKESMLYLMIRVGTKFLDGKLWLESEEGNRLTLDRT